MSVADSVKQNGISDTKGWRLTKVDRQILHQDALALLIKADRLFGKHDQGCFAKAQCKVVLVYKLGDGMKNLFNVFAMKEKESPRPALGAVVVAPRSAEAIAILDQIEQHVRDYGCDSGGRLSEKLTELRTVL